MTRTAAGPGQRVLVTGGSGFVGPHVVRELASRGYSVRAAARAPLEALLPGVEYAILPDLSKPFDARPVVARIDVVVHLAGIAHTRAALPESAYQAVNTNSAQRFAEAARDAGVKKFVFLSSVRAQCGPSASGVIDEQMAPSPTDAYGRSKLAAEVAIAEVLSGSTTAWVALRPVLVYGDGVKGNMQSLFRLAQSPLPLPVAGLTSRRSLLSIGNLASAIVHAMTAPSMACMPYLVADAEALTVPDIITALRNGLGRRRGLFTVPQALLAAPLRLMGRAALLERLTGDLVVDTSRLTATGWSPPEATRAALAAAIKSTSVP